MNNIKNIKNIIKSGMIVGSSSGFLLGMCINNKIRLNIKTHPYDKTKNFAIPKLLLTSFCGGIIPPLLLISSPIIIYNYFSNSSMGDKLFDNLIENIEKNYKINCKRYHQYDGKDNKYAFPSYIHITIEKINNDYNKNDVDTNGKDK